MSKVVTVGCLKGGPGKTTLSLILGESLARRYPDRPPPKLIDLDTQGSLTKIIDRTPGLRITSTLLGGSRIGQLPKKIIAESRGQWLTIMDTPPLPVETLDIAIGVSDFLVAVAEDGIDPIKQGIETMDLSPDTPSAMVINRVQQSTTSAIDAHKAVSASGRSVFDHIVYQWAEIKRIDGSGWPTSPKVLEVIENLTNDFCKEAGIQ